MGIFMMFAIEKRSTSSSPWVLFDNGKLYGDGQLFDSYLGTGRSSMVMNVFPRRTLGRYPPDLGETTQKFFNIHVDVDEPSIGYYAAGYTLDELLRVPVEKIVEIQFNEKIQLLKDLFTERTNVRLILLFD